jgi:hypothetical protein
MARKASNREKRSPLPQAPARKAPTKRRRPMAPKRPLSPRACRRWLWAKVQRPPKGFRASGQATPRLSRKGKRKQSPKRTPLSLSPRR